MKIVRFTRMRAGSVRAHSGVPVVVLGSCIAALGGLCAPSVAQGQTVQLTCVIKTAVFSFKPPLDGKSTSSTVAVKLSGCLSPDGSHTFLHSATVPESSATATGCAPLPMTIRGDAVLAWDDGSRSVLRFNVSTNPADGPLGLSAALSSGRMAGATATAVPATVNLSGLCGLGGTRSFGLAGGLVTFTRSSGRLAGGVIAKLRGAGRSPSRR